MEDKSHFQLTKVDFRVQLLEAKSQEATFECCRTSIHNFSHSIANKHDPLTKP